MKRIGLTLMAIILVASPVISQIIHVPADQNSIQMAINMASNGDTVLVADGKYVENINFRGKTITVASHFLMDRDTSHISKTIIDGSDPVYPDSGSTVTMLLARDTTSVLCGFTIQGGSGTGPYEWILDPGITTMTGGGIIHAGGKIINNIIKNNHVSHTKIVSGGGISGGMVQDIESDTGVNIVIRDNIVTLNSINSDEHYSGGAGIGMDMNSRLTIVENNEIFENISTTDAPYKAFGGGMNFIRLTSSTGKAIIRNNFIHDNEVHSKYSFGGGLFYLLLFDSPVKDFQPLEIYNNLIVGNHSDYRGGGACFWYIGIRYYNPPVDPVLTNNTIVDNFAETGSGLCAIDAKVALFNNILWNELADESGTEISDELFNNCGPPPAWCLDMNYAKFYADYNNIQGGWTGTGNIDVNPGFILGSFELGEGSPCIGRGVDSFQIVNNWFHAPAYDYFNNPRPHPIDARIDMGAIESPFKGFVFIPDTAFLYALIDKEVDTNGDSLISYEEAKGVTLLDVSEKGISDMKGIESFINLDSLYCWSNNISSIDVSNNTALKLLSCGENNLVSLDVSNNTALIGLDCSQNNLVSLDVSNNSDLWGLLCWENEISTIDISNNPELELFWPAFNQLTSLDVSNNPALSSLNCTMNQLASLDVSANTALELLWCDDNQLTNLNLSNNTALKNLSVGDMPTLIKVCVWEMPFPPSGVSLYTKGSPNICFTTDCGSCSNGIGGNSLSGFSIYPNPTNDLLTIETEQPGQHSIEITSLNGQQLFSTQMEGLTIQINLSTFQKGIYFITIRSKDYVTTRKIIKL